MKLKDLSGKTFGRLRVISRASPVGTKHIAWNCECSCGTKKEVNGQGLLKGAIQSCGCLRRDMGAWNKGITGIASHSFRGIGSIPQSRFGEYKYKARERGIEFEITIQDASDLFESQEGKCAPTGIPIGFEFKDNAASLDRINSSIGYTKDNIQWVDRRINFMKQSASTEEFISMCKAVTDYVSKIT